MTDKLLIEALEKARKFLGHMGGPVDFIDQALAAHRSQQEAAQEPVEWQHQIDAKIESILGVRMPVDLPNWRTAVTLDQLRAIVRATFRHDPGEAKAWSYELATTVNERGQYTNWSWHLTRFKPVVPPDSIRNLESLYTHPAPSDSAVRKSLSAAERIKLWHVATVAHGQHSSFNWFEEGIRTAEKVHGIKEGK